MRDELRLAMDAAREAGLRTLVHYEGEYDVRNKGTGERERPEGADLRSAEYDPVTSADLEADACLREILHGSYPEYGWLSEETADSPERLQRPTVWIVDPIDGTKEFVSHIPEWGVSIALVEDGVPTVGVIFNPAADELYSAVQGGGTFLNGKRVFCTEAAQLAKACLIVSRSEEARGEVAPLRSRLAEVRPVGSVAYKLAQVAAGAADVNVSVQPKNEWDVCAGDLLVREAGGRMVDLEGQVRVYNQRDPLIRGGLAAGNCQLTDQMLAAVAELCP